MINKIDKNAIRTKRHERMRSKIQGTAERPRLNVYRSLNNISCQIIDDVKGHTLVACSTLDKDLAKKVAEMTKCGAQSRFCHQGAQQTERKPFPNLLRLWHRLE